MRRLQIGKRPKKNSAYLAKRTCNKILVIRLMPPMYNILCVCMYVCVSVRACVRAGVRACVRACVRAGVWAGVWASSSFRVTTRLPPNAGRRI